MSTPSTLAEAWAEFVLAMLRRNGPLGLFTGLTLRQRGQAIDHLVPTGRARLHMGAEGVWVELAGAQS